MDDPWKALKDTPVYESDDDIVIKKKEKPTKVKETKAEKKKRLDDQKPVDPLLVLAGMVHVDDSNEMMKMGSPVQTIPEPVVDDVKVEPKKTEIKETIVEAVDEVKVEPVEKEEDIVFKEIKKHDAKVEEHVNSDSFLVTNTHDVNGKYEVYGLVSASVAIAYSEVTEYAEKIKAGSEATEIDDARGLALEKLIMKAKDRNANALIGVTYQITDLMGEVIDVLCIGTCIRLK